MVKIKIPTETSLLEGVLHIPAKPAADPTTLIICHGFRGSKDGGGRAVTLAEKVCEIGIYVIRFDFTPASTLSRQIAELAAVVRYACEQIGGRVMLLGRSMGGSAALQYTAMFGGISALCLWAAPWDLQKTFRLALGAHYQQLEQGETITLNDEYGQTTIKPDFIADFDKYDLMASVQKLYGIPLLQIHGTNDDVVPVSQAHEINLAAQTTKKLVIIEGGGHHLAEHADIASQAVVDWLATQV